MSQSDKEEIAMRLQQANGALRMNPKFAKQAECIFTLHHVYGISPAFVVADTGIMLKLPISMLAPDATIAAKDRPGGEA